MIQRAALFAGSLAAALALAVGLVVAGFAPAAAPIASTDPVAPAAATADAQPAPIVQVDTVYQAPPAAPQEITVTRTATAITHGDDEGGGEGDD
jgi:hypothetical protein